MTTAATKSPILFLVYNRPEHTQAVFAEIRRAKPPRLYVAADGPRAQERADEERCAAVRRIATAVDWPCRVETLFRTEHLGCGRAVSSALSWFFRQEPEGIVLEDDTVPAPSFFGFMDSMIERHRDDKRVFAISGCHMGPESRETGYYRSHYFLMWGWSSWADRWSHYSFDMKDWDDRSLPSDFSGLARMYWQDIIRRTRLGMLDTWDYQWMTSIWRHNGLTVRPTRNLVENIGFDETATHTRHARTPAAKLRRAHLPSPFEEVRCSKFVQQAMKMDEKTWLRLSWKSYVRLKSPKLYRLYLQLSGPRPRTP